MNDAHPEADWSEPDPLPSDPVIRHAKKIVTLLAIGLALAAGAIIWAMIQ